MVCIDLTDWIYGSFTEKTRVEIKPPVVTAKSWAIFDGCSGSFIEGKIPH